MGERARRFGRWVVGIYLVAVHLALAFFALAYFYPEFSFVRTIPIEPVSARERDFWRRSI